MDSAKKRKLEAAGWQLGDAADFLGLSAAESELVEVKLRLAAAVQQRRADAGLTQAQLAKRLGTSQPRVATMLAAKEVSIDNLVRSLLVLGADATEVAKVLAGVKLQTAWRHKRGRKRPSLPGQLLGDRASAVPLQLPQMRPVRG